MTQTAAKPRTNPTTTEHAAPHGGAAQDHTAQLWSLWRDGNVLAPHCPSRAVLQHLTSRWGTLIMVVLAQGPKRFAQLRREVGGISERMLAQTLKDLESDGFVLRVAYPVVPPHVDYSLTPLGTEAARHVTALTLWIETNLAQILENRGPAAPG